MKNVNMKANKKTEYALNVEKKPHKEKRMAKRYFRATCPECGKIVIGEDDWENGEICVQGFCECGYIVLEDEVDWKERVSLQQKGQSFVISTQDTNYFPSDLLLPDPITKKSVFISIYSFLSCLFCRRYLERTNNK